ncbi:RNA polymerase III Rpc82 C -terminal, partial [Penicillium hispanicum]|uniref:RNA polymerase III Rpc82 C -terminal n=1 Tax=Penicillium hispanicum TaxID=1080232 RepID=UPI0025417741
SAQYAVELCALLIEDNFGELFAVSYLGFLNSSPVALQERDWRGEGCSFKESKSNGADVSQRVFLTLQRYERLSFPRLKYYSRLSDRQLQHGLTAMIQHHLVYHFTSLEDGNTYYEANPQAAYYLVRSGKILHMIEARLGEYAASVMEEILYLGHASVQQLQAIPKLQILKPAVPNGAQHSEEEISPSENGLEGGESGGINGTHHALEMEGKPAPLNFTLKVLASHGYLKKVRDAHFQSPADNWLESKRAISARSDIKALKGKRQEEAILAKTQELVAERTHSDLSQTLMVDGLPRGVKRRLGNDTSGSSHERLMIQNGPNGDNMRDNEDEENDWSEDEDGFDNIPLESGLVVRVNYEKLDVALRNARFVDLAVQDAPAATAKVYGCLLRRVEYVTTCCRDSSEIPREGEEGEQWSVPIEFEKLMEDIDPLLDLSSSIGPLDPSQSNSSGKRPLENGVNGSHDSSAGANRMYEVVQHLRLLEQAPYNLTSYAEIAYVPHWRIGFRGLARKLRHLELERMIETRYGDVALRVVRVLHAKGKLDEKRLQEISMLPIKDLRQTLASMQSGGFVDLQEVPKDAQRQPSKTIFLWYYDPDRVCSSILEDTYKAMSRTLQRIKFERDRLKDFLEKTERSDVKGHEEQYLTEGELEHLQHWKDKEALLLAEVARLDDMVAVFRDY